jgi:hypothetical protein
VQNVALSVISHVCDPNKKPQTDASHVGTREFSSVTAQNKIPYFFVLLSVCFLSSFLYIFLYSVKNLSTNFVDAGNKLFPSFYKNFQVMSQKQQ